MSAIDKNVIEVTDPKAAERLAEIMEGESHPLPVKKKDMVEVVRCRDCKYWIQFCEAYATCNCGHGVTDMEFYCRDGERWKNEAD